MTAIRAFLASFLLAPLAIATDPDASRAGTIAHEQAGARAGNDAGPLLQLAQKIDAVKEDNKRKGKGKNKGKEAKPKGGSPPSGDKAEGKPRKGKDAQKSKPQARKQKEPEQNQPKDQVQPQKQDAERARRKDLDERRRELQQTKDNARKQKQLEAQQAKENALKARKDAEAAKQKAIQDKRDADAARLKAIKDKQEADAARQKALQDQKGKDGRASPRRPGKFDRAKADQEFERARKDAQRKGGSGRDETFKASKATKFETLRRERKVREAGSRDIIVEPDKRVIVRDDKRLFIRHDDGERFRRKGKEVRRERRKDGTWMVITASLAGALIYSILDDNDRVLRRSRRDRDGHEYVFFDDRRSYRDHYGPEHYSYIDLPPPIVRIPRDRYIVEYDRASPDDLFEALNAPPIEVLDRGYTLDEVRQNYSVLERMRRVDLNVINFEFASWDVAPEEYSKLDRIAHAMQRVLDRSPGELFLIEGHTDAVGSEIDNLSLSDRRAEAVAIILTDEFGIPPENLTTQGYGEEYLKEPTEGPSWVNRRVGVRRVTPLLSREGWDDAG
ncbi:OmpA family protein [Hyphomicrobium sp.]|uniref:OmpA family protein n=1 Tax=Hyphomicrobium sp. TaxID=82 RepID=UPI002FE3AE1A